MRILYVSTWFPYPPDNGARIRTYQLLKALSARHEVFLISQLQEDSDQRRVADLSEFCKVVSLHQSRWFQPDTMKSIIGLFSSRPRSVIDTYDLGLERAVRDTIESFMPQVVVASTIGSAPYIPPNTNAATIFDNHNCEFSILKRTASEEKNHLKRFRQYLGWKKAESWELRLCRRFKCTTLVSYKDREMLQDVAPDLKYLEVVPNGVDTEFYQPNYDHGAKCNLIYNGALTYGANLDAVRYYANEIYPLISQTHPGTVLKVTGRFNGVDLGEIRECPGVELTGYVTDTREVIRASAVCVVPIRRGGGSRLKILEAMASGVPVVSTSTGAEGLDVTDGVHLLIADQPEDFSRAIARLLDNLEYAHQLAYSARELVQNKYSWDGIGRQFCEIAEILGNQADIFL